MDSLQVYLVTSDDQMVARLRRLLHRLGHGVAAVAPTLSSVQASTGAADVTLLDARGLRQEIPSDPDERSIVYVVREGQIALIQQMLDGGPHAVVAEPFTSRMLGIALATALARSRRGAAYVRQALQLRWLQEAAHAIAACETVEQVLSITADHVQHGLGYDRIGLALVDESTGCLHAWVSTDSAGRRYVRKGDAVSLSPESAIWRQPAVREVFLQGRDYYYAVDTWAETPEDLRERLDGRIGEGLVVALRLRDRPFGWIAVDNLLTGRHIGPEEAPTLIAFAREVAVAMEKAFLREAERRRTTSAEALTRATAALAFSLEPAELHAQVLGLLSTVVTFDYAALLLIADEQVRQVAARGGVVGDQAAPMRRFAVQDDPLISQWARERRVEPELIPDTCQDPRWPELGNRNAAFIEAVRCYLGAPLVLDGDLVGVLCLASRAPRTFDALTVGVAAEFADRLVRAYRNARLYEAERTANARLQDLIRLQDDFVATVSHELRTPLTSILGFAEHLERFWDGMDEGRRRANVEKIQRAGARLDLLIRDLLQLARSDAAALHLLPGLVSLAPLVAHASEEIAAKYPDQVVTVRTGVAEAVCWADADRVNQILVNLLDNAAKYSSIGTPCGVDWEQADEWGILTVCDAGPGIRPEDIPRLFRRFGKLNTVARAGQVGTGLGLYICKQLAEAMGGQIWYEPVDPAVGGRGSRFRVRLPLHRPAPVRRWASDAVLRSGTSESEREGDMR